jgi:hypothetical protein
MTRNTSQLFLIARGRGITFGDIAKVTDYSAGTIRNLASGANTSAGARRAVEKFLGRRIWKEEPANPSRNSRVTR